MLLRKSLLLGCLLGLSSTVALAQTVKLNDSTIINKSSYVIECTQMIGGYCSNNPVVGQGGTKFLPDPGSKIMRGHVMVFAKDKPGAYVDNIVFVYKYQRGQWKFNKAFDLYKQVTMQVSKDKKQLVIS